MSWTRWPAALVLLAALSGPTPAQVLPAPWRLMPIGDSITEGDAGGYRLPLMAALNQAVGRVNFVGHRNSRNSDPATFTDNDHDGYSAYRIDQITTGRGFWHAPSLEERLQHWEPAAVTLHAGTNDAQQNYHFDGDAGKGIAPVIDRLDDMVSRIVAHNPAIDILVAQIIPANAPASATTIDYVVRLNSLIPGLVARHQALGHRVAMVDLYTPMLAHPNPDGIHPSAEGARVMAEHWFQALMALGTRPRNPDPGRDDGLNQVDHWSRTSAAPWVLQPNLLRAGSASLAGVSSSGYDGRKPVALLNDGLQDRDLAEADNQFELTYTLDTAAQPQGYDVQEIRTHAGRPAADNGDERAHQAYTVWWAPASAPGQWQALGDFHHILVNREERASRIVIRRPDGQPLARGVGQLQFRFVPPPRRQMGFIGIGNPTHYREIEALGEPSP